MQCNLAGLLALSHLKFKQVQRRPLNSCFYLEWRPCTSVARCLPRDPIRELDLWESSIISIVMQVIACFVLLGKPHTLPRLFSKNHITGTRVGLPILTATMSQNKECEDSGTQVNLGASTSLSQMYLLPPFSMEKGKKLAQGSKPEVEILPFPSPWGVCLSMYLSTPQKSPRFQLTTASQL